MYIWQAADWPNFQFDEQALSSTLQEVKSSQQRLLGQVPLNLQSAKNEALISSEEHSESTMQMNALIQNALIQNAMSTSAIEGEVLDVGSVRSSVARHLGLESVGLSGGTKQTDALIRMLLAAMNNLGEALSIETLCHWQRLLFPEPPLLQQLVIGALRDDQDGEAPMQVVSVKKGRYVVHFEAPPKRILEQELQGFLTWFNERDPAQLPTGNHHITIDPFIRAGIAHLWFVTLHPFDDGNGRLARAITDRALSQAENASVRLYSMSSTIERHRNEYYDQLERIQNIRAASQTVELDDELVSKPLDVTSWLHWFLTMLNEAMEEGCNVVEIVAAKSRFWYRHSQTVLHDRQIKVLNRLLDNFDNEFTQGINASKYQSLAKVSKATATRDLTDLLKKGCVVQLAAGGRSTRYQVDLRLEINDKR